MEVSLNSVIGLLNPMTMKLRGLIEERDVVDMVDPRATHNFLSLAVVNELGVDVTTDKLRVFGESLGIVMLLKGLESVKGWFCNWMGE